VTVKKMNYGRMTLLLLVFSLAMPAWAEFYRYVDQHGNVVYTDDLSKVPVDQRSKVQPYEESPNTPQKVEPKEAAVKEAKSDSLTDDLENERQKLHAQENTLNQEYEDLMKMRSELNEEKNKAVTNSQIKSYNKKIIDFNERIKAYEKKRDTLAADVKSFNQKVEARPNETEKQ
jgi:predicted  nucleic acid-binding Zn-ribbon protein